MQKLNKISAGYHMLMILSQVDGKFNDSEEKVIVDFLHKAIPLKLDSASELKSVKAIPRADYFLHFNNSMNDFYEDSTEEERVAFLKFAVELVTADEKVTVEENKYLKELFFAWDSQFQE